MSRAFFIIAVFAAVFGGYIAAKYKAVDFVRARFCALDAISQNTSFRPTAYPLKNRPFTVILIGRNNGALLQKTLDSVFSQRYDNFRLVYVDDGSDDGSDALLQDLIADPARSVKTKWIRNAKPRGVLCNLIEVMRECSDEEIAVVLDAEDRLAHEWVLQRLNEYYADPDLWLAYAQCLEYPACQVSAFHPYLERSDPGSAFRMSKLQTFYASLFKQIHDEDFRYQGEYMQGVSEIAYMLPMLEMGADHFQCLSDVLYISTQKAPRDSWEYQPFFDKYVRSLKPYDKIRL